MTTEERVLRLENAFATLAEMSAQSDARHDQLAQLVAQSDARQERLAQMVAQEAGRTDTLLQLVRDHDERMETQQGWINQLGTAQSESEAKIAALADAQIRTEEAQANADVRIAALIESQAETGRQLRELAEIVRAGRNGHE